VDSFANKLLSAHRQATEVLAARIPADLIPPAAQQSFLLSGGNFVGVRWQAGDWAVAWMLKADELVLLHNGFEAARMPLEWDVSSPGCGVDATPGPSLDPAASQRRAA
jgi:hypothetical protein